MTNEQVVNADISDDYCGFTYLIEIFDVVLG